MSSTSFTIRVLKTAPPPKAGHDCFLRVHDGVRTGPFERVDCRLRQRGSLTIALITASLGSAPEGDGSRRRVSHPLLLLSIGFIAPVDCVGLGLDGRAMVGGRQRTYSKSRSPPAVEKVNRKHQLQQVWARKANCVGKGLDTSGRHRQGW